MINPRYWSGYWRARRALADYPLYDVPNKSREGYLPRPQVDENFAYFMRVRLERMECFQRWLSDWFGIDAPLTGDGVLALEAWADRFAGGLITNIAESSEVFTTYSPRWTGERRGYNVLIDIAIFLGEFLISKRPHLHWALLTDEKGSLVEDEEPGGSTLGRPDLAGFCWPNWSTILFQVVYLKALACRYRFAFPQDRRHQIIVSLAAFCRENLHVASVRDPRERFVFEDYSHGPL